MLFLIKNSLIGFQNFRRLGRTLLGFLDVSFWIPMHYRRLPMPDTTTIVLSLFLLTALFVYFDSLREKRRNHLGWVRVVAISPRFLSKLPFEVLRNWI